MVTEDHLSVPAMDLPEVEAGVNGDQRANWVGGKGFVGGYVPLPLRASPTNATGFRVRPRPMPYPLPRRPNAPAFITASCRLTTPRRFLAFSMWW